MARSDDGNFSQFASIKTHFREMWNVKLKDKSQTICQHFAIKSKNLCMVFAVINAFHIESFARKKVCQLESSEFLGLCSWDGIPYLHSVCCL